MTGEAQLGESGVASLADDEGADDGGEKGAGQGGELDPEEAIEQYEACMQEQGQDVGDMFSDGTDAAGVVEVDEGFIEADEACNHILEAAFGSFEMNPEMEAALADQSVEVAQCLRDTLGIDVPDDFLLGDEATFQLGPEDVEPTPEQEEQLDECFQQAFGDMMGDDGVIVIGEAGE